MDEVTAEEKDAIQQLRNKVLDVLLPENNTDIYLRKWLRARNFNLEGAEEMLRKHRKFMKIHGLDNIEENFVPMEATDYFHTAVLGYDNEGSVVRMIHIGAADLRGLALSISKEEAFKFAAYTIKSDILRQKKEREGKIMCDKQAYIFDLQGLSWSSIIHRTVVERAFTLFKNYENNFPEHLKVVYVVHAPSFFSFVYNWLKTIIPESVLSKVMLLTDENITAEVTKNIDPSIVPVAVGGTKQDEDGDPNCPSIYKKPLNSLVPESLYLSKQLEVLENDPAAKRATVECGCAFKVRVSIKKANSVLMWDFQTAYYDIRFGLNYQEDENSEASEIIPPHRVQCHQFPESGSFSCSHCGLYDLVFDNTYSWMTKKDLIYKVKIMLPEEIDQSS